jgi:hypothetical protein
MIPRATDLFGKIPVPLDDLNTCYDHLKLHWRKDWYIHNWNVADKVRQAKLDGVVSLAFKSMPCALK